MDTAVALVQTYLQVNGYLTVTEYPLVETHRAGVRSRTDLDIIALRFAAACAPGRGRLTGNAVSGPDPVLRAPLDRPDMIIGEVKEGAARFNDAMRDVRVLRAAISRFGCCQPDEAEAVAEELLSRGSAITPAGHQVRMIAFGTSGAAAPRLPGQYAIELGHVLRFLQRHIAEHRNVFMASQPHDPVLALLSLLDKAGVMSGG